MSTGIYGKIPLKSLMLMALGLLNDHKNKLLNSIDVFSRYI